MTPGTCNLQVYRGDTARWQFKLWEDAEKTTAADLSGASIVATIRDRPSFVPIACTVTLPNIIDAVLAADAWSPPRGGYVAAWDLQVTWADGDVGTVLSGKVTVSGDATE